ncbi:hypothetical protein L208DRAFT_176808 [Tricholoma matsutake]|nr:hypothetical protein L208DRAFT_176808 [Tricholoma matsutake 945]
MILKYPLVLCCDRHVLCRNNLMNVALCLRESNLMGIVLVENRTFTTVPSVLHCRLLKR